MKYPQHWSHVSTAWRGLESYARSYIKIIGRVETIVEIGVDWGYSLFAISSMFPEAKVIGVDNFSYPDGNEPKVYVESILKSGKFPNAELISMESAAAREDFLDRFDCDIDVLHIDADHSYAGVRRDFEMWSMHLRYGGVVLFHDIHTQFGDVDGVSRRTVGRFFDELPGEKLETTDHSGFGAWYKL